MPRTLPTAAGFLLGTILLTEAPAQPGRPAAPFVVGEPFPSLVLPDVEGRPRSIAEFRGRKLILHIFASW